MLQQEIAAQLDRRQAVATLLRDRGDLLVITGLGSPAYDAMAAGDHDRTFYLWGAMGGAAMMGLGLALARPQERVAVITGDGEQLMGVGGLLTIGAVLPKNLAVVVLDNRHYGETGMQPSHTALGIDLVGIARASGFAWCHSVTDPRGLEELRSHLHEAQGPGFASILVKPDSPSRALPPRDGVELKNRFRRQLGLATI
ncbi:thiamine pyrophosphate-dependent enzyme [Rhodoligotrophos defluvii]|uniref:thiamine pyrophosphate-dependent enzyme n=1 Tax=Rhodoligotrophos defluvii TaxID=2561934 RepID=UPI0010C94BF6|nr:thiamine pyrophosphate-dependent enzyme [Rhodoligotrophos defluvii]